jgi:hypothetical protein
MMMIIIMMIIIMIIIIIIIIIIAELSCSSYVDVGIRLNRTGMDCVSLNGTL